jgi:hypothetical protein
MKRCAYCDHLIVGDFVEIAPESASGARPTAYWHKTAQDCKVADQAERRSSPLQRRLSHL